MYTLLRIYIKIKPLESDFNASSIGLYKDAIPRFIMKLKRETENDDFYTPANLVLDCLGVLEKHITDPLDGQTRWLDPSAGYGAWFNEIRLNETQDIVHYCEIKEGLDFFQCQDKYDIIVGNPPFSQLNKWLAHSVALSQDIVAYILPAHGLNHKRLCFMEAFGFELVAMHSFQNPKAWNVGFAHFFCIWKKPQPYFIKAKEFNYCMQKEKTYQYKLSDFGGGEE